MVPPSRKKIPYPVQPALRSYLDEFSRGMELPVDYELLTSWREGFPIYDAHGHDTLWRTLTYSPTDMRELSIGLRQIYALLKASGDVSVMEHLRVSRIDFCEFGNSQPFRIRIVNALNDNQDYFYLKKADASRIYGLELEHLLSPNRMHFFVWKDTLVEEHIVGIPGDAFIAEHLNDPGFKGVRIAKEFVKFNERCFIRLLGDMRSYNFVVDATPDFEEVQYRIRAMDFDQQSYDGRVTFYKPQYFNENTALIEFGKKHMDVQSMRQYQAEERALIALRMRVERERLDHLLDAMCAELLAPAEKVRQLAAGLTEHYHENAFLECRTMGELLRTSLEHLPPPSLPAHA
ncbi:MAG: hypothetical protein JO295_12990 [Verrucomicrobia bacterium]|nr:hypothetical protein [Verrucomicrobiota bacterium]